MLHETIHPMPISRNSETPATTPAPDDEASLESLVPVARRELKSENACGPALTRIANKLLPALERFMAVRWSGLEDSELIAGEALATALAKLDNYHSEQGSLMSWVIGIAQRKALTAYRRQTADKIEEETKYEKEHRERFHFKARPDEALTHALLEAILAMPEADHYLLHLTMVDRLSIAAAAKILKITPALARKKKQRFLAALEQIKNNPPPPA